MIRTTIAAVATLVYLALAVFVAGVVLDLWEPLGTLWVRVLIFTGLCVAALHTGRRLWHR